MRNDGVVTGDHPVIICTEIKTDNPHCIFAVRELQAPVSHQSLYLPYGSVALIIQFEESASDPIGFCRKSGLIS